MTKLYYQLKWKILDIRNGLRATERDVVGSVFYHKFLSLQEENRVLRLEVDRVRSLLGTDTTSTIREVTLLLNTKEKAV